VIDWQRIFRLPDYYLDNLVTDDEIERQFKYIMPAEVRAQFSKTEEVFFDVKKEYDYIVNNGEKSKMVLERSIIQHAEMCVENSEDVFDARILSKLLNEDIEYRVRMYSYCISNSTKNYRSWLEEDYMRKLRLKINSMMT